MKFVHDLLNPKARKAGATKRAGVLAGAGDAARNARDWRKAAKAYAESLALNPRRADLWVQLGHAEKESGDLDAAEAAYAESLSRAPDVADTYLQMGHLKKLKGQVDEAGTFYLRAAEMDPSLGFAIEELRRLSVRGVVLDQERLSTVVNAAVAAPRQAVRRARPATPPAPRDGNLPGLVKALESLKTPDDRSAELAETIRRGIEAAEAAREVLAKAGEETKVAHLMFDVSDLVGYFEKARLPTGIQRVQIEVISGLLADPVGRFDVAVCSFSKARDQWVELPLDLFSHMTDLARLSGDITDEAWVSGLEQLQVEIDLGSPLVFPRGAYLINLGTSWWLQNYFLHVRQAKELYGIHYIPFVHDMIPIMTPEHCTVPLTQDFISWALGVFSHADYFFTNSEASKRDLVAVAATLGHTLSDDRIHVVRLDADFRKEQSLAVPATLRRFGLTEGGYVLFVSTIESRKNHLGAFKAWLELMDRHPASSVLTLVCVGNRGWLNDQVFAQLDASPKLRSRVRMLSKISDADLANLYRGCAFTLYPSSYEGWGLPVTESLSYGKPALLSDASSLPEAGGAFADYFPQGDQPALVAAIERLMFDLDYRREREAFIKAEFKPRSWALLGQEIGDQINDWFSRDVDLAQDYPRPTLGRYHWLRRIHETAIYPGLVAAEIFRTGSGWWQPDDWGSWTKASGGALTLNVDHAEGPLKVYVGLLGLGSMETDFIVSLGGSTVRSGTLERSETLWLSLSVSPEQYATGTIHLTIWGAQKEDFAVTTKGVDTRVVSVGVIGFMVCREDDFQARVAFTEALALDELPQLADGWAG